MIECTCVSAALHGNAFVSVGFCDIVPYVFL